MTAPSDGPVEAVRDNPARSRFELPLGAEGVGFINYRDRAVAPGELRVRVLTHAEVPAALRGGGIGAQLAAGTLDLIRSRGERIVPRCPFIVDFIRRHPEYLDLVAD